MGDRMNWSIKSVHSFEYRYFRIDLSGIYCLADMKSASSEMVKESAWRNGDSLLIDGTLLEMGDIGKHDVDLFSGIMERLNNKLGIGKVAIVACSDFQFGLARMFQMKTESHIAAEIRAFRYATAAIDWLTKDSLHLDLVSVRPNPYLTKPLLGHAMGGA